MESVIRAAFFSNRPVYYPSQISIDNHLALITKGEINYDQGQSVLHASVGELVLIKHMAHSTMINHSKEYERLVLKISPGTHLMPKGIMKISNSLFSDFHVNKLTFEDTHTFSKAQTLFENIIKEKNNPSKHFHEELLNALTAELLIFLYNISPKKTENSNDNNYDVVISIINEFESNPGIQYTLPALAEKYNISISGLSHFFKRITGISVISYLNYIRIEKAKEYLKTEKYTISEIIDICGFSCTSSFNRLFKKSVGVSPSEHRMHALEAAAKEKANH